MKEERDWLPTLIDWFQDAEDATVDAREKSERDRDYYDNKQFTAEEFEALRKRGQPAISHNLIRQKIDYLLGLEKQTRSDPKAYPRNPDDEQAADAATSALRFVADDTDMPMVSSDVWENMLIEGAGGFDVYVEPRKEGAPKVCIVAVPWDRMVWDPHARRADFSDARYLGVVIWLDADEAKERYPDHEDAIESTLDGNASETFDDRPKNSGWGDAKRKRVRIVQMHWQSKRGWMMATFTKGGFLEDPQMSPYLDDEGEPECSLVFQSAYVDRDNNRYGAVRDMIDQQDEVNKRRSKALHLLSVRQVVADQGAVQDVDEARRQVARADGYVEVAPQMRFEIQQTADLANGQALLLQQAQDALAGMGPNASMQGKDPKDQSGKAIALQQQGGAIQVGALADLHRHAKRRAYRAAYNRVRQFWTEETWVRITDDDRNVKFVGLNRKVTLADALLEMGSEEEARQAIAQMGLTAGDPRLKQVVRVDNRIADVPVDIILDESPDVATLQIETFTQLTDMVRAGLPIPPTAIIEAAPLRPDVKEKVLKQMSGQGPDGKPLPPPPEVQKLQFEAKKHDDQMALEQERLSVEKYKAGIEAQQQPGAPQQPLVDPIDAGRLQLDRDKAMADEAFRRDELALKARSDAMKFEQTAQANAQRAKTDAMKARQPVKRPA